MPDLDLGRLPIPGPHFVGRDAELARLDAAWEDPRIHVLTFVAFGGVGKSALVARWLDRMSADGWRGATRVLDWSFYSQGTKDRVTSAEPFIDYAFRFFGDPNPTAGSLHDRGARLAKKAVLTAVSDSRPKPASPPVFPGTGTASASPAPDFPGDPVPVLSSSGGGSPRNPGALARWTKRLAFLEEQEALAVDDGQKFVLKEQIEEAREKIREYEGTGA